MTVYAVYWSRLQIDNVKSLWLKESDAIEETDRLRGIGVKAFVKPMEVR